MGAFHVRIRTNTVRGVKQRCNEEIINDDESAIDCIVTNKNVPPKNIMDVNTLKCYVN